MLLDELSRDPLGFPFLKTLRNYSFKKAASDLYAALAVSFLATPQGMAYAVIAGVNPIFGLYAAIIAAISRSIAGNSKNHIAGPSATLSVVVAGILFQVTQPGYSTVTTLFYLTIMVGIIQIIFAVLKLGKLVQFVSLSAMSGFITGSAIVIFGDQLPTLLGIEKTTSPYFFERLTNIIAQLWVMDRFYYYPLLLGLATVAVIVLIRLLPVKIPAILSSLLLFTFLTYLFQWQNLRGIDVVGSLPAGIPTLELSIPVPSFLAELFGPALAIALLASVQGLAIAKSLAIKSSEPLKENQELLGLGVANLFCGLGRGFPISGSFTNSFLNYSAGGKTPISGIFMGIIMLLVIYFLYPLFAFIPYPVLAGLIVVVAVDIIDWDQIKVVATTTRRDRIVFTGTMFSVLMLTLDQAIYLGMITSLVLHVRKAAQLDMKELIVTENGELKAIDDADERIHQKIAFIDVIGEAFFGSADLIKYRIQKLTNRSPELKVIILRMKNAMNLDITGALALKEIAKNLREEGRTLMICGATPHTQEILEESNAADVIGRDKILVAQKSLLTSTRQAIDRAQAHIDNVINGQKERQEESPPLKYTMSDEKEEKTAEKEEPIKEEKTGHHEKYDEEG
ncbi:MAG: SulP family inorganic anion transporter [bacterium]